jgi:VWFA-related protein
MKSFLSSLTVAALLCLSLPGTPDAQQPAGPSKPTLKTNTRLVVVDVVATDSEGRPISGLNAPDFTVFEDGHPQKISGFNYQQGGTKVTQVVLHLPPNVVSNIPTQKATNLNVVVLDTLNGDFAGHVAAQDALIKYLDTTQLTQPMAIFSMQDRLTMLHDFTTDSQALKSVVEKFKPPVRHNGSESMASRISAFTTKGDYHTDEQKIEATLNQLHLLARTLGGYPGRKNVIWLSESFPLVLAPETAVRDSAGLASMEGSAFDNLRQGNITNDYSGLVQKLANAMMSAQVAMYPVDSTGLGKDDHLASQHTMSDLAFSTGGRAFFNRNDLEVSLRTSLDDGSSYYTLTYYPDNKDWNGKFRIISIKAARPGAKLRYRLGYYALDPGAVAKDETKRISEDFSYALTLDTPSLTAVQFQARAVMPSDKTQGKVLVNFAIDAHTLAFERSQDGVQHASVSCAVWAFSGKGDPVRSEGNAIEANLPPEVYQQMMASYFPCARSLSLKPGHYTLRLGVLDRTTNQMGTTTAEVTVP